MNERAAMAELFDENQAYALAARRMNVAMEIIMRQLGIIEKGTRAQTKQMNEENREKE